MPEHALVIHSEVPRFFFTTHGESQLKPQHDASDLDKDKVFPTSILSVGSSISHISMTEICVAMLHPHAPLP